MRLYLVQHAKAASKEVDPDRPLTEQGRRDIEKVAAFIKPLGLAVDDLWHSGKTRAAQTAQVLAGAVKVAAEAKARSGLGPDDDVAPVRKKIEASQHDIMLVGHLPFLSKLASLFLTGDGSAGIVAFRQGGIVCLERSAENQWQVGWMVTPEILPERHGQDKGR